MRNRSSTGVLSSPAPHLAGELQSSLCMNSMHVCTKRDLILLFVVVVVCKDHCRGYFTAPTSHPSGRGVPIQPAVYHMYRNYVFIIHLCPRVTCTMHPAPHTSYLVPHALYPVPRTSHLVPRTSHPVSRTSYLVLCTSSSAPSTLYRLFLGLVRFVRYGQNTYCNFLKNMTGIKDFSKLFFGRKWPTFFEFNYFRIICSWLWKQYDREFGYFWRSLFLAIAWSL